MKTINQSGQTCESRSLLFFVVVVVAAGLGPGGPPIRDMTGNTCFKTTFSSPAAAFWPLPRRGGDGWGEVWGGGETERQIWMVFLWAHDCCRDSQVKHMHLNPGRGCTSVTRRGGLPRKRLSGRPPPCVCVAWNRSYLTRENVFGCP